MMFHHASLKKVGILGPGVLGGSLALAVQRIMPEVEVMLWGRSAEKLKLAAQQGISQTTTDLAQVYQNTDLAILCVPVGVMADLCSLEQLKQLRSGAIVTDVGSVKKHPHQVLGSLCQTAGVNFIGSHPMAGSEQSGFSAARSDLFEGAACVLTNDEALPEEVLQRLDYFWSQLGCRMIQMSAELHDRAVARVSHFPHLLAALCSQVGLKTPQDYDLSGGGMRDTSRVASGAVPMWTEIIMNNADSLDLLVEESLGQLSTIQSALRSRDTEAISNWLLSAKEKRDQLFHL